MITICKECRQSICPSSCPNYKDVPIVYECDECGYPIYDGDEVYKIEGKKYCKDCIESFKEYAEVVDYLE